MAEFDLFVNNCMNIIVFLLVFLICVLNLIGVVAILQTKQAQTIFSVLIAYYTYVVPLIFLASILNYFSLLNLVKITILFLLNLIFIHLTIFLLKNQQNNLQNQNKTS